MLEDVFVSYFDILGFTSRFVSGGLTDHYENIIRATEEVNDRDVTIFLLSDSIIIISHDFAKVKDITQAYYTAGILHDFWLRGAITRGNIMRYDSKSISRENKVIVPFLGEGYLKAYVLESQLNVSGIVMDDAFFERDGLSFALRKDVDYIEYEEYLPKRGNEGTKRLLLPSPHSVKQVIDTMYFEEMLKSHVEDIDKYINTFCLYIKFIFDSASQRTTGMFLDRLLQEFELHGRRVLIPSKAVIIFVAVIDGLLTRFRSPDHPEYSDPVLLEADIGAVLGTLKEQGYLATFIDYLLDYDKRRHTSLYKDINSLRSH